MTVRVAGVAVSTEHWIGGKRVGSRDTFADLSPIDGAHLADVAAGGAAEVDAAVAAARAAFPAWAERGPSGRLPILKRFAEGIQARAAELAAVETVDNGSLLAGNLQRVVPRAALNAPAPNVIAIAGFMCGSHRSRAQECHAAVNALVTSRLNERQTPTGYLAEPQ
jgi:5-carboxymethyl-2-hydroxymuconic-semialdehyde dehydrogenase